MTSGDQDVAEAARTVAGTQPPGDDRPEACSRARSSTTAEPIHAYVHVAHGFDAHRWRRRWESGELIGLNESSPYGYHRAQNHGVQVAFSRDAAERPLGGLMRKAIRVVLGFDFVHAWRNRRRILAADVVWTHTESQHLGVAAILGLLARRSNAAPRLLAQSVWLFDRWERLSPPRRVLYRKLLEKADVLTVLSPTNRQVASELFPRTRVEFVPFGICADDMVEPSLRKSDGDIRVLAVGNDRHRDWPTLISALAGAESVHLRIVSQTIDKSAVADYPRAEVLTVSDNTELLELYQWADVVALPLKPNRHASGVTVLQEAVIRGVPVVVSDTGGLRAYFDDECVAYVEPQNAAHLRSTVLELRDDPSRRLRLAKTARSRMGPDGLSSEAYVRRHCVLSAELTGRWPQSLVDHEVNRDHTSGPQEGTSS